MGEGNNKLVVVRKSRQNIGKRIRMDWYKKFTGGSQLGTVLIVTVVLFQCVLGQYQDSQGQQGDNWNTDYYKREHSLSKPYQGEA